MPLHLCQARPRLLSHTPCSHSAVPVCYPAGRDRPWDFTRSAWCAGSRQGARSWLAIGAPLLAFTFLRAKLFFQNPSRGAPRPLASAAAEAWDRAKEGTSVAVLEAFIARYKDTFYADLARARIEELTRQPVAMAIPPKTTAVRAALYPDGSEIQIVGDSRGCPKEQEIAAASPVPRSQSASRSRSGGMLLCEVNTRLSSERPTTRSAISAGRSKTAKQRRRGPPQE